MTTLPATGPRAAIRGLAAIPAADYLWLVATLLLSLALRIPFFDVAMIADEGGYAYATRGWIDGTGDLYDDLWISRPQGIFILYAGIFETLGTGTVAFRLAAWIACAMTTVLVWMIARKWSSPRVAILAAACFAVVSSLPNLEGYTANAEIFMGVPAAASAWLLLRARELGWTRWHLLGIGIATGLATQLKPAGLVMFPVAIAFILLVEPTPLRTVVTRTLWISAGVAVTGVPSFIHGWYLGWDDFIYATMSYRLTMQSSATSSLPAHAEAIADLLARCSALLVAIVILLVLRYRGPIRRGYLKLAYAPHPHPHLPTVKRPGKRIGIAAAGSRDVRSLSRPDDPVGFLIRLWAIGCLVGIAIGGDWWPHYLIQIVAPFSIWFARTAAGVWQTLWRWDRVMMVFSIGGLLLFPFWVLTSGDGSPRAITGALFGHAGYPAQEDVAAYLKAHTEPGTAIFVAFDQPAIYYLADRPAAYRHLYEQELKALPNSYGEILSMIQGEDRPMYIVTTRQADLFPDRGTIFWQLVGEFYVLETEIDGVPIYRARDT